MSSVSKDPATGTGTKRNDLFGLSADAKTTLLDRLAARRQTQVTAAAEEARPLEPVPQLGRPDVASELARVKRAADVLGIDDPYFRECDGIAGARIAIGGRIYDNFVSYNYLGLNGDPRVSAAAKAAIDRYGTSVSASRFVSGERPLHRELETALAEHYSVEDCLAFVSGHATNVTVIGHLLDREDAIVHDSLSHNSIVQGAVMSGAQRFSFQHNRVDELERIVATIRPTVRRVLIVIEGHYSMDGDIPDLPTVLGIAARHRASVMVDEAHSLGVIGPRGRGIAAHFGIDPSRIDVWMGTLSKTLSGCGGYIAGSKDLISYLRYSAPGFVYSVGLAPPIAAAALEALRLAHDEPDRIEKLHANGQLFLEEARVHGLDTGTSIGAAIIPVMIGSSIQAARVADLLFRRGINVQPIIHPAVPERSARLRFFLSSLHEPDQIRHAVKTTAEVVADVMKMPIDFAKLAEVIAATK